MPSRDLDTVPIRLRPRVDEVVAYATRFATAHLDAEYAELARRMAVVLSRKRPSPLERGDARTWAAAILHAAGWVNFLTDPTQEPHMTAADLAAKAGVGQSTIAAHFRVIREALDLVRFHPEWTRPSRLLDNPLAWLVMIDGLPVDVRHAPREIQEEAFRLGLIPFVPDARAGGAAGGSHVEAAAPLDQGLLADVEAALARMVAEHPDATFEELNAALARPVHDYNHRPQAELGGLSPAALKRLLGADWDDATGAVRLHRAIPLAELEGARTLHDARVVLDLVAEQGEVRATPKGNLPRAFVAACRERMRDAAASDEYGPPTSGALNEEDVFPLHIVRVLLELAGLLKRRTGRFSLTRRGTMLRAPERAGELFALLFQAHFRRLDLAYMDGIGPSPAFQGTIAYAFYRFGGTGADWQEAGALADALVLPLVRDEVPTDPYFDVLALMLETRFLRPLEGLGLAEGQAVPRTPDVPIARRRYRRTALFDRFLGFDVARGG